MPRRWNTRYTYGRKRNMRGEKSSMHSNGTMDGMG